MSVIREFDPWKNPLCTCPPKYSLSPYTGCGHSCIYCYASSYIRNFYKVRPKKNLLTRIKKDLRKIDRNKVISIANSSDPYTPPETELKLTREVLKILVPAGCKILLVTKSDLVLRDLDIIKRGKVSVSITITTLDKRLAKILEPGAPPPDRRIKAIRVLSKEGIGVSVRVDPIIPLINDDFKEIEKLVEEVSKAGAKHLITSTYKAKPDSLARIIKAFPDYAQKFKELYLNEGERISGYWYLKNEKRLSTIKEMRNIALAHGLTFASCREGFGYLNTAVCDGSHLINYYLR